MCSSDLVRLYMVPFRVTAPGGGRARRFAVILTDVTKDKQTTEARIEDERTSSILLLAAGVAHELGNPLNSLTIHLQLIERKLKKLKASKDNDVIVDRTGLVLSDASRGTTRMRKVDEMTMEAEIVIEDAKALKAPWKVTKRYRKQPAGTWAWDYACAENNRNPVSGSGKTLTLGPDGKPIDKAVD